jgi:hypothetical protein
VTHGSLPVVLLALVAATPVPARAQSDGPAIACEGTILDVTTCRTVAQAAEAIVPLLVVTSAGGNPVPGTASTLGMRLTSAPRWTLGSRTTLGRGSAPDVAGGGASSMTVMPVALGLDGSVGILPGWNPLPTVGGVA